MADSLKIDIDVSAARAELKSLDSSFAAIGTTLNDFASKGASAINRFNTAVASLNKVKVAEAAITEIGKLTTAFQNVPIGIIGTLASEMRKLGNVDISKVTTNVGGLNTSLQGLKVPPGMAEMTTQLNQVATAAKTTQQAFQAKVVSVNAVGSAMRGLGTELLNTAGYMSGLGVTTGQLVQHFLTLRSSGMSIGEIFKGLVQQIGLFGAVVGIGGMVAQAFQGIHQSAQQMIKPILDAGQAVSNFKIAIDSLRGAGQGAEQFERLQAVANRTGQDLESLTKNFQQFDASAQQSGISAANSAKMFEQVATATRVMGIASTDVDGIFRGLNQMMSKGTVQAEELRGQIGDRFPGAFGLFAEALNMSTTQLDKMLRSGQLATSDVLPKFTALLERKFGSGLAASLETASAAINKFSTAWFILKADMAQGDLGGVTAGFAAGVSRLAEAMQTEAFRQFAQTLGDLLGVLTGGIIGAIAGLVSAVSTLATPFVLLGQGIESVVTWMGSHFPEGANSATSSITKLTNVVTMGVAGLAAYAVGMKTLAPVIKAIVGSSASLALALGNMVPALKGATTGFAMFTATMNMNPIVKIAAILLGLSAAIAAVYTILSRDSGAGQFVNGLNATSKASEVAAKSIETWLTAARKAPNDIISAANSFGSYAEMQTRAKREVEALSRSINAQQASLKSAQNAIADSSRSHQQYTQGIQQINQELERQKGRLERAQRGFADAGGAANGAAGDTDVYGAAIENLSERIRRNNEEMQDANAAQQDRALRDAEFVQSAQEAIQADQRRKEVLKEYGVALDESGQAEVRRFEAMGLAKEKAVEMVVALERLNQTEAQRAETLQAEATAQERQAKWALDQITRTQEVIKAKEEEWKAQNRTTEEIARLRQPYEALIGQLQGIADKSITSALNTGTMARSFRDGIPVVTALEQEGKALGERLGRDIPAGATTAGDAINSLNRTTEASNFTWKNFGEVAKIAWDTIKQAATTFMTWLGGDTTKQAQERVTTTATAFDALKASSVALQEPIKIVATNVRMIADSMVPLATNLPQIVALLPSFTEQMTLLSGLMPTMGETFPLIGTGFLNIMNGLLGMGETFPLFVENMKQLPPLAEGVTALQTSFTELIKSISDSNELIVTAVVSIQSLTSAMSGVVDAFGVATEAAAAFASKLTEVVSEAENAVTAMNELTQAANEALAAAQAANAAAAGGGGGGGEVAATEQRMGGYAGEGPEASYSSGVFANAPAFARGGLTNNFPRTERGGGIPSILHPNEAVVPLPGGREIPVDIRVAKGMFGDENTGKGGRGMVPDLSAIAGSIDGVAQVLQATLGRGAKGMFGDENTNLPGRSALLEAMKVAAPEVTVQVEQAVAQTVKAPVTPAPSFVELDRNDSEPSASKGRPAGDIAGAPQTTRASPIQINLTINTPDLDGFKRSQDQIIKVLSDKIKRVNAQNG